MSATATAARHDREHRPLAGVGRAEAPKPLRCAIYTRKSTENGLEQAFNSLDNQREAAEAYIKSQAHEGWRLIPGAYDDGGFSGGSLERPAIQRLLAEVRAGRVDVIVVYKVDRLTRSLSDFARLVDLFDAHGVSFVSVTQAFNTTTSMGRLTLNVLLSFAQFEREVTGERIRDKIAASKRKGIRVGGPVPLGYQVRDKKLLPDPTEAETVNLIFRRYLDFGSLSLLLDDLRQRGVITKTNPRRNGTIRGGIPFERGSLAALLKNRAYIGEIVHKRRHFPGEHPPIVERALFDAVQEALASRARNSGTHPLGAPSLLNGLLHDDSGRPMLASLSKKNGARYRYYASSAGRRQQATKDKPIVRVAAPDIEAIVIDAVRFDVAPQPEAAVLDDCGGPPLTSDRLQQQVERIILRPDSVEIVWRGGDEYADARSPSRLSWSRKASRRRRAITAPAGQDTTVRPIRAETRSRLISGIANARAWLHELASGRMADTAALALRQGCSERSSGCAPPRVRAWAVCVRRPLPRRSASASRHPKTFTNHKPCHRTSSLLRSGPSTRAVNAEVGWGGGHWPVARKPIFDFASIPILRP